MQVSCSSGPALAGTSETTGCGGNGQLHPDSLTPFMFTTAGVTLDFHREREEDEDEERPKIVGMAKTPGNPLTLTRESSFGKRQRGGKKTTQSIQT